jgi:ribosomal protein L37AE/L43A
MTPPACMRCSRLGPTRPAGSGLLHLCAACPLEPACGEYQHTYVGSAQPGLWVCLRCGSTLESVAISPAPVVTDVR